MKPLFEENANATLGRVLKTYAARGAQYGDTWRNSQHLNLRAVFRTLTGHQLPIGICTALAAAVLVDVKCQRSEGGYKDDTMLDEIAYRAFLAEEMEKHRQLGDWHQ